MRVHARVDAAPVGVGNVMIFVAKVDAVVPGGEYLDTCPELGGEVELSGVEHPTIEREEASAAYEKGLNSAIMEEIDLCPDWTPAATVGIHSLSIGLPLAYQRQWDHLGNIVKCEQMTRKNEATISCLDLVHATVRSAAERMAVSELPVEPEPEFIRCVCGSVLGASDANKERRYQ